MIDAETWDILAARLEQIRRARDVLEELEKPAPELVFDIHDQATLK